MVIDEKLYRTVPYILEIQAVFALATSEEFWVLLTSVLIQDLSWDTRSRHAGGGGAAGRPLQGGGERGLDGRQTARLCHTLRCHAIVLEVCFTLVLACNHGKLRVVWLARDIFSACRQGLLRRFRV